MTNLLHKDFMQRLGKPIRLVRRTPSPICPKDNKAEEDFIPLGNPPAEHDGCGAGGLHPSRSAASGGLQVRSNMESHPEE
jgi:hypothetical protein